MDAFIDCETLAQKAPLGGFSLVILSLRMTNAPTQRRLSDYSSYYLVVSSTSLPFAFEDRRK
jgi:hypothetical protein